MAVLLVLSCVAWADEQGVPPVQAGELRTIGTYPLARHGHTVTSIGPGRYFLHGAHIYRQLTFGDPTYNALLMQRRQVPPAQADRAGVLTRAPWIWLPDRRGWKRLGELPECRGDPYMQIVTPLLDGGVLLTGGLCDEPKMRDDLSGHAEYRRTSRLNGQRLTWEASPELVQGRIYHTAPRLSDGAVVVVGGQRDPGLGSDLFPVLSSVERLRSARFETVASMRQARAGHTATVLEGDTILVTGGFDNKGKALSSVERWDLASERWQSLPPLKHARYGHRATLLDDGRVLVTGGLDAGGKPIASTESWDPANGAWVEAAPLPVAVGFHDSARMTNGDVLLSPMITRMDSKPQALAYIWQSAANAWALAATVRAGDWRYLNFIPAISPQADSSAKIFGAAFVWDWRLGGTNGQDRPRDWYGVPALARLDDRSVIVVTLRHLDGVLQRRAYRWEANTGVWQAAGELHQTRSQSGHAQAIRLGSGRVVHLIDVESNALHCEISPADLGDRAWEFCGRMAGKVLNDSPFELGLLPDGRAAVITNFDEAFVFDESRRQWQAAALEWRTSELAFGTPVRSDTPLAQLVETRESGDSTKLDVSALAGRFWEHVGARRDYNVIIDSVVTRRVKGRGAPPAMLWNPEKGHWDYIFLTKRNMGRNPVHLPDGCAISMAPPSVFDPKTGHARMLDVFPGGLDTINNQIVALGDGTVVVSSAPVGGTNGSLFAGKASCAGLATTADIELAMPPIYAADPPPAVVAPVAPPPKPAVLAWRERIGVQIAAIPNISWLALALVVILGLVRLWLWRRNANVELPHGSRLDRPVTTRWRHLPRIVIWLVVLAVLGPAVVNYWRFRNAVDEAECMDNARACLDPFSGLIKSIPSIHEGHARKPSGPHIPCRFVGQWSSIHGKKVRRITLDDDGTYQMAPLVQGGDRATEFHGYWMVQSGHFVWRASTGTAELDINLIDSEGDGAFVLVEANGSRTRFERIEAKPSSRCLPDRPA